MKISRLKSSLCVAPSLCLAGLALGCSKQDSAAEWEKALDASEQQDDSNAKDAGGHDNDDDEPSSSPDTTQDTTSVEDNTTTSGSTGLSSSSASTRDNTPSDGGTSDTDESGEDTEDSDETSSTPTNVETDAGGGSSEGEVDVTANPEGCEGYLLCETFEDVDVGAIPDDWQLRGEAVAVSSDDAHSGQRSLKIDAAEPGPRQLVRAASVLGAAHWGRVYYRVDLPVPDAFVHSTIVALSGDATESGASEFRVVNMNKQDANTEHVGSKHNWAYNVQVTGGEEWVCESNYDRNYDADWHCAEYFVDAASQTYELYIDDSAVELGAGSCERMELPQQFEELRVGFNYYANAAPGFVVYLDDIAFDDARIGCD